MGEFAAADPPGQRAKGADSATVAVAVKPD
jgi:hypothetical protein